MRKLISFIVVAVFLLVAGGLVSAQVPPNNPPVIETASLVVAIPLAATISDDGLPSGNLTSKWVLDSGPSHVWFGNDSQATTLVLLFTPGTYVLRLTADDGELLSSKTTTIYIVEQGSQ